MRTTRVFSDACEGFALPAILALVLSVAAPCVEPGKPSKASLLVAMWRAIGARNPDAAMRNPDYLGGRFLGAQERALMSGNSTLPCLDMKFEEAMQCLQDPGVASSFFNMLSSTKHIDLTLRQAVDGGTRQVVIWGAGFDCRADRFGDLLDGVKVGTACSVTCKRDICPDRLC